MYTHTHTHTTHIHIYRERLCSPLLWLLFFSDILLVFCSFFLVVLCPLLCCMCCVACVACVVSMWCVPCAHPFGVYMLVCTCWCVHGTHADHFEHTTYQHTCNKFVEDSSKTPSARYALWNAVALCVFFFFGNAVFFLFPYLSTLLSVAFPSPHVSHVLMRCSSFTA